MINECKQWVCVCACVSVKINCTGKWMATFFCWICQRSQTSPIAHRLSIDTSSKTNTNCSWRWVLLLICVQCVMLHTQMCYSLNPKISAAFCGRFSVGRWLQTHFHFLLHSFRYTHTDSLAIYFTGCDLTAVGCSAAHGVRQNAFKSNRQHRTVLAAEKTNIWGKHSQSVNSLRPIDCAAAQQRIHTHTQRT